MQLTLTNMPYVVGGSTYQIKTAPDPVDGSRVQALVIVGATPDFFALQPDQIGRIGVNNLDGIEARLDRILDALTQLANR